MGSGQDTFEAILQEQSYITYVAETLRDDLLDI